MTFWTAALMFFACSEPSYTYGGFAIYDHFPLDGAAPGSTPTTTSP